MSTLSVDRLADLDLLQRLLRQEEIDKDRVERLQRHDRRCRRSDIGRDRPRGCRDARRTARAGLLVDHRLLLRDLGARVLQIDGIGIDRRLADRLRLPLLHVTLRVVSLGMILLLQTVWSLQAPVLHLLPVQN